MKKVLFVYHKVGYGGANKMLAFMANSLSQAGYEVYLAIHSSSEEPQQQFDNKIKLFSNSKRWPSVFNRLNQLNHVVTVTKEVKPDLVISLMSLNSFYSYIAKLFLNVPLVISERGDPSKEKGFFASIKHFTMNRANFAVFQTEGARAFFSKRLQDNSIIIPNPVILPCTNDSKPWHLRKDEIAFVGRFELVQKRQDIALLAMQKIVKKYPNIKLNFYGDGDDLEHVIGLVDKLGLAENVVFKGKVNNVLEVLGDFKYFILTSDYEGIPNALIEAMSVNVCCLSTDCDPGGARLLIEHEQNGFLVKKGDYIDLANKFIQIKENENLALACALNASNINQKFSEDRVCKMFVNYINKIVGVL